MAGFQKPTLLAEFAGHIEKLVSVGQNFATQLQCRDVGIGLQAIVVGKQAA